MSGRTISASHGDSCAHRSHRSSVYRECTAAPYGHLLSTEYCDGVIPRAQFAARRTPTIHLCTMGIKDASNNGSSGMPQSIFAHHVHKTRSQFCFTRERVHSNQRTGGSPFTRNNFVVNTLTIDTRSLTFKRYYNLQVNCPCSHTHIYIGK